MSSNTSTSAAGALAEIQTIIGTIAGAASAAVVSVGRNGRGTGFVVAPNRVLTSAHNLRDQTVAITFADSRTEQGAVHAVDADGDLIVIDVPTAEVAPLSFAESLPTMGAAVVSIGRGGHRTRTTLGFVSGLDRAFHGPRGRVVQGSLEHTAPLARGSSGGPVFDVAGAVVGINTHRIGDGFYLARPADASLQARIAELVAGHSVQRRTLGIAVAPADVAAQLRQAVGLALRDGVLVRAIDEAGPAGRAGVVAGDLIVRLGSTEIGGIDDLQTALAALTDDTVELALVRGADDVTVTVSFTDPS
ncbi:MAG: serine protease [Ilumatobacteraceae bacterium]|nr:serine protease [Ilumatobacteraceae bacterium]